MTQTYELEARYDSRASFYRKAHVVVEDDGTLRLWSYGTHVASIKDAKDGKGTRAMVFGTYSATTLRHIKEFLLQNGYKAENKKQILKDHGEQE